MSRCPRPLLPLLTVAALCVLSSLRPLSLLADDSQAARGTPLAYATESRTEPRTLRLYRLTIDLHAPDLQWVVLMADDPDGDGPAETVLARPSELAARQPLLAAVNTNAWTMVPPPEAGERPRYVAGAAADVSGWVQTSDSLLSPPERGYWSLWMDLDGRAHIGNPTEPPADVRWAVSGFGRILRDGEVLPRPSDVLHPRTAAGLDPSGRWLTLLIVDGRRTGHSEGVSERELAELMREFGCSDALNLDGGGSSILLYRDHDEDRLSVKNLPSDLWGPRPVPVMLGIARRQTLPEDPR